MRYNYLFMYFHEQRVKTLLFFNFYSSRSPPLVSNMHNTRAARIDAQQYRF